MFIRHIITVLLSAGSLLVGSPPAKAEKQIVWTGWFSDSQCARSRAAAGTIGATNPDCAKTCLQKGIEPAFISEQANAVYGVKGYPSLVDDLGYHLEVTGTVDDDTKTVIVAKVRRLHYEGAACSRSNHHSTNIQSPYEKKR